MSRIARLFVARIIQTSSYQVGPVTQWRFLSNISDGSGNFGIVDGVGEEPWIPPYVEKEGESVDVKRARLLYQSRKRGMLENGLLLSTFAAKYLSAMTETQLRDYDLLINLPSNDWEIFYWATGVRPTPPEFETDILNLFKEHVRNQQKELRIRQPDLE